MSANLASLAVDGVGLNVWCYGHKCGRFCTYVPIDEAIAKFGLRSCEEISRALKCEVCGARGRDGKIQVLPSTMDHGDVFHGKLPGTSERLAIERRAENENRDRDYHARMGWPYVERY